MKAEPETRIEKGKDVKFSIDDLAACAEPQAWDGGASALLFPFLFPLFAFFFFSIYFFYFSGFHLFFFPFFLFFFFFFFFYSVPREGEEGAARDAIISSPPHPTTPSPPPSQLGTCCLGGKSRDLADGFSPLAGNGVFYSPQLRCSVHTSTNPNPKDPRIRAADREADIIRYVATTSRR